MMVMDLLLHAYLILIQILMTKHGDAYAYLKQANYIEGYLKMRGSETHLIVLILVLFMFLLIVGTFLVFVY